jgi:hypothetical protein
MIKRYIALLSLCAVIVFVQCARQHRGIPRGDGYRGVGRVETTVITKNDAVIIRQEQDASNDTTQLETTTATAVTTEVTEQIAESITLQDESVNTSKTIAQVIDSTEKEIVVNEEDLVKGHKNIKKASGFLTVGTIGLIALFGGIIGAIISGTLGGIFVGALISFLGSLLWIIGLIGAWIVLSKFKKIEFVDEKDFQKHKRQKVLGIILLAPIFLYALFFLIVAFV